MTRISVIIPAFNAEKTIGAAIDSVLRQSVPVHEILVLDDGSSDATSSILGSYGSSISASRQENRGVADTRNTLCRKANGELIALLDADDVWHPSYLATQVKHLEEFPEAIAFFTGHIDFVGYGDCAWVGHEHGQHECQLIRPEAFLVRYCATTGLFGTSWSIVRRDVLTQIGDEPFQVHGAEDSYLFTLLPLLGPVGYSPAPLVGRRVVAGTLSSDSMKVEGLRLDVFRILEKRFRREASSELFALFEAAYASKQRQYAKRLLGARRTDDARRQLRTSFVRSKSIESRARSTALLAASFMPTWAQPTWPAALREWKPDEAV